MPRPSKPHPHRGKWRVRINGTEHTLGKNRRQAFAKYHRLMAAQYEAGAPGRPTTVAGAIEVWLRLHPNPKHLTWLARFTEFAGRVALDDVTDDLLHNYHDFLLKTKYQRTARSGKPIGKPTHYAQETMRNYMRDAASVLRLATKRKWCFMPEVPFLDRPEFVDRSADPGTLWNALDALPKRSGCILRFIAATGCRPGEACALKWDNVKLARRACVLPRHKTSKKTGEPRIIPLTGEALAVLHETPHVGEYVFLSRFNRPYTVQGLRSIAKKHLDMTTYDLRHTFAQACIDDGIIPEIVTKMMGHRTNRMVWTYARIKNEQVDKAASHLKLRRAADAG